MSEKILTKEEQKEIAVECLEKIGCYKPYAKAFKDKGIVTLYEGVGGYYLDKAYGSDETELMDKIKEVEEHFGGTVYAVIHNFFEFGECYTMLFVSKYKEDAIQSVEKVNSTTSYVFAWVWNKSDDDCSEFGTVAVRSALGGLLRVS